MKKVKTLKDAIGIIMAQPPELHYPAYYADLLSEADVPETNIGKCSEIPNSSDTISRQAAIDALSEAGLINYAATGDGNGMIQAINVIKGLPPAQPETHEERTGTHACDLIDKEAAVDAIYHHCNDCGNRDCGYVPDPGQQIRFNCPLWRTKDEQTD